MATRQELYDAIRRADAAGDGESVRKLASYIDTLPAEQPAANEPTASISMQSADPTKLPARWSPTVNGSKVDAFYSPDVNGYLAQTGTDLDGKPIVSMVTRDRTGKLGLRPVTDEKQKQSLAMNVAEAGVKGVIETGRASTRLLRNVTEGVASLPYGVAQGYAEMWNALAPESVRVPEGGMPLTALHTQLDRAYGPDNSLAGAVVRGGAAALTGGGALRGAGALMQAERGAQAATTAERVVQSMGTHLPQQAVAGAAGAGAAHTAKEMGASPNVQALAGLIGSFLPSVGSAVVNATAQRIAQKFTAGGREAIEAQRLIADLKDPAKAQDAVLTLRQYVAEQPDIGQRTTGQVLASGGHGTTQAAVERGLARTQQGEGINARMAANEQARAAELNAIAPGSQGAAEASRLAKAKADAQQAIVSKGQTEAEQARAATGKEISDTEAGQAILSEYDAARAAAKAPASAAFEIDPFKEFNNLPAPVKQIQKVIEENYAGNPKLANQSSIRQAIQKVNEVIADNLERRQAARATEEQQAQQRAIAPTVEPMAPNTRSINPEQDDILAAIAKYGGLSREEAVKFGIDPAALNQRSQFGLPIFRRAGGKNFDEMAQLLDQHGYPVRYDGMHPEGNALADTLEGAMRGQKVLTPVGWDRQAKFDLETRALEEYKAEAAKAAGQPDAVYGPAFGADLRAKESAGDLAMSYDQAKVIASQIGALERAAKDDLERKTLGQIKVAIRGAFDQAVAEGKIPAESAQQYKDAVAGWAQYKQTFGAGIAGKMEMGADKTRGITAQAVPKAVTANIEAYSGAPGSFRGALGGNPNVKNTMNDWLATKWRDMITNKQGDMRKPGDWQAASDQFMKDYDFVLRDHPELVQKMKAAIVKSKTADELAAKFDDLTKKSGLAHFLGKTDAEKMVSGFINSTSRQADTVAIQQLAKENPAFQTALKAAFKDYYLGLKSDAHRVAELTDPANQQLVTALFGDKTTKALQRVADDAIKDMNWRDVQALALKEKNPAVRSTLENVAVYLATGGHGLAAKLGVELLANKAVDVPAEMAKLRTRTALEPGYAASLMSREMTALKPVQQVGAAAQRVAPAALLPKTDSRKSRKRQFDDAFGAGR